MTKDVYIIREGNEKNQPNRNIIVATVELYLNYLFGLVDKYKLNGTLKNLFEDFKDIDFENLNDDRLYKVYNLLKFTLIVYGVENSGYDSLNNVKGRIDEFVVEFLKDYSKKCIDFVPYISRVIGEHDDADMSFNIVGVIDDENVGSVNELLHKKNTPAFIKVIYNNQPIVSPFEALDEIGEGNYCCVVVKDTVHCLEYHHKSDFIQMYDFADMINSLLEDVEHIYDNSFEVVIYLAEVCFIIPPISNQLFG